ncbi:hypothetical protein F5876DRAFT_30384 [Lentinula aff. lateritia]|uniref:Uncharacterized protein n=1 Tax=Lentinula aff. lateritia TaxID=2804960 RepID=A0ACC1UG86_9AGAR|nr:hypothetical protein F5876DRAFT_30384 [Lentinula aff. lateritia]
MYSKRTPQAPPIARAGACNNCKQVALVSIQFGSVSNASALFSDDERWYARVPELSFHLFNAPCQQRCDGRKPVCGPCTKSPSLGDCEYAVVGHTYADRLQEQIGVLEARLEQLQTPSVVDARQDSVALHHPYPSSASMSSHAASGEAYDTIAVLPQEKELTNVFINFHLISLETFLPYASHFGFFLDARSLVKAFSNPISDPNERPTSALSASIILLGAHFSAHLAHNANSSSELMEKYLSKAIQAVSHGLSDYHPHRILHTLQSYVLVAYYFLLQKRSLEGRWHLDKAVSLIISAQMHRIRSSYFTHTTPASLSAAQSASEEGERINAMWTVFALNCLWSAVEGIPASIAYTTDQGRVDTPWPLDSGRYSNTTFPRNFESSHTLQKFLSGIPDDGNSILALYVKATVLFEQTTVFWKRYSDNCKFLIVHSSFPKIRSQTCACINKARLNHTTSARTLSSPSEVREFQSSYQNLFALSTRLLTKIPPFSSLQSDDAKARLLVIHTLVRVTIIRLQCTLGADNPLSRPTFLDMANGIMDRLTEFGLNSTFFLDPMMAVSDFIPSERHKLRSSP